MNESNPITDHTNLNINYVRIGHLHFIIGRNNGYGDLADLLFSGIIKAWVLVEVLHITLLVTSLLSRTRTTALKSFLGHKRFERFC